LGTGGLSFILGSANMRGFLLTISDSSRATIATGGGDRPRPDTDRGDGLIGSQPFVSQMIPEYNEIMRFQADLDRLARPFGGKSDGWGVMLGGDADAESA
jgi:hypothetical protein